MEQVTDLTIGAWLAQAKTQIATLDAELILLSGLRSSLPAGADRSYFVAHDEMKIAPKARMALGRMLRRRIAGEPLAYILGKKEFYGRDFKVNPAVLIPRSETESLIELVKSLDLPRRARFCEIGTGSGCIAITLALEFPQAEVVATDISERALNLAEINDLRHEGRVEFLQADLLQAIGTEQDAENAKLLSDCIQDRFGGYTPKTVERDLREQARRGASTACHDGLVGDFDVLIANLPYVDAAWPWLDRKALGFEPSRALYAKEEGLALYRRLLKEIWLYEQSGDFLTRYAVFEADPVQHEALTDLASDVGFVLKEIRGYGLLFERDGN